jgi:hypothetical protein
MKDTCVFEDLSKSTGWIKENILFPGRHFVRVATKIH